MEAPISALTLETLNVTNKADNHLKAARWSLK